MKTFKFFANTCPTCNRAANSPYRAENMHGEITQGCVDEFHTGHLTAKCDVAWHDRLVSQSIRKVRKQQRGGGVTLDAKTFNNGIVSKELL